MIDTEHDGHARAQIDAADTLQRILAVAERELPFAAQIVQLALQSSTLDELERYMTSVYRLALEHGDPLLPDLVDELLRSIEASRDAVVVAEDLPRPSSGGRFRRRELRP